MAVASPNPHYSVSIGPSSLLTLQAKMKVLQDINVDTVEGCRVLVKRAPDVWRMMMMCCSVFTFLELAEIISRKFDNQHHYYYVHYVDCMLFCTLGPHVQSTSDWTNGCMRIG